MAFPQASDYRPPIIPDGEIYDNPENGKSYYWTQILVGGSTPETATSISGYWTVVCEPVENKYLLRHGDTINDADGDVTYTWNDGVIIESDNSDVTIAASDGAERVNRVITDSDIDQQITNKRYVNEQDELLRQDIIELEEEINAIAPSLEYGTWKYEEPSAGNVSRPPSTGTFYLINGAAVTNEYSQTTIIKIHNNEYVAPGDTDPVDNHTWADADVGELIQLFDAADPDFFLGKITAKNVDPIGEFVTITVDRVQSSGVPNDNPDPVTGEYLTRINIFKEPSGGDASEFVLKAGDQMTGELQFYKEQADNSTNYSNPSVNTKDIRFSTKRLDTDGTTSVFLYQPGYSSSLVCSASLMAKGNLYTDNYLYGTTFNGDGTRTTKNPRIYLRRSVNSSGAVTSEYGALKFSSTEMLTWDGTQVVIPKTAGNSTSRTGFTIKGATSTGYGSTVANQNGDLLKVEHVGTYADRVQYFGRIATNNDIATKKYVDDKAGGVKISCSSDNRSVGDLWYCSSDQVLYLKVS